MKKTLTALYVGTLLTCMPLVASASAVDELHAQIKYALGQIAALKAGVSGSPACALVATKSSAKVGEHFALIWNTFGAQDPASSTIGTNWERGGVSTVLLDIPGTYEYKFVFNGVSGGQTTCTARITIHS